MARRSFSPGLGVLAAVLVAGFASWQLCADTDAGKHAPGSAADRLERLTAWGVEHRGDLVRDLAAMTAVPSVSQQPQQVERMATTLASRLERLGMKVENIASGGPPLLLATGGPFQPDDPEITIVFYAHYDGQNVDASRWKPTTPFEPALFPAVYADGMSPLSLDEDPMQEDWRLYARAVSDDKGPIAVLLATLEGIVDGELGPTAIGVEILLDGEEESGDPHLGESLAAHAEDVEADLLVSLDGPVFQTGDPTVVFGVRGITTLDLTIYGAIGDLHSGHYGNWASNPAQELAWLLGTLKDPFTGEVKVEGFYGCRRALTDLEASALADVPDVDDQVAEGLGVVRSETQFSLKHAVTHPSLNVRGLSSGHVGTAARTVIPARAEAAIDIRLVPDCEAEPTAALVRAHIEKLGYRVLDRDPTDAERSQHQRLIKITGRGGGYRGVRTPMDWAVSQRIVAAVARATGRAPVRIPNMGGSLPFFHVEDKLGMRVLALPLVNHDNNQHGPNENVRLGHLWRGFDILAALLLTYGEESDR